MVDVLTLFNRAGQHFVDYIDLFGFEDIREAILQHTNDQIISPIRGHIKVSIEEEKNRPIGSN